MVQEQRFMVGVRIIGSVHRDTPKLKMFMISVLWSDESEVIVYRSFKDFKRFHDKLKKKFPSGNPFKKNDRMVPKFKGKARDAVRQKGSKRAVQRMKFLENYCNQLLKCDQAVTQSSEATQFFLPKEQDLQPDFTKNSIMILMSDDISDGSSGGDATGQRADSITQPFVAQTYRCVDAYETKDTKNRPFKVTVDEKLDVLIKDPAGWWMVENEEKRLAWFPAPYLELWEAEEEDDDFLPQSGVGLYCAVRSYVTKKDDEVSVPIGSVVEVLRMSDDGWWLIRFNGKGGYIPSMYLKPYNNPRAGMYSLQRKLHNSTLNLATSARPQSYSLNSINEESAPQMGPQSRGESGVPGRLHKARSLDVLSEPRPLPLMGRGTIARRMSNTSTELSFSSFSGSESDSSSKEGAPQQSHRPEGGDSSPDLSLSDRRSSNSSSASYGSDLSSGSSLSSAAPRVPPRPKTQEILTRCTTMTRKAALSTKTRLELQPERTQIRLI